jgi:polysaccharide biosynthesis protein PslG
MRRAPIAIALAALAMACCVSPVGSLAAPIKIPRPVPPSFFGIVPQTGLTEEDVRHMQAGGIGSVRMGMGWDSVQATRGGPYDWDSIDREVAMAASQGLQVLPFLAGVAPWLGTPSTTLPIDSAQAVEEWKAFVSAAVRRYGPNGEFWAAHPPGASVDGVVIPRPLPIRTWQIWNEVNFFYFAYPVSPARYARLLKPSYNAIKSVDSGAKILLSGLFGDPREGGPYGMSAAEFLNKLYRVPRIEHYFDAVALHPYAFHVGDLEEMVEDVRAVMLDNDDPRARLRVTEMGWGSQDNSQVVAFEQGIAGQKRELKAAYRYLLANRRRLKLDAVYWFSWKDSNLYCSYCDSVGFFSEGSGLLPKPAWYAFVGITGGQPQP